MEPISIVLGAAGIALLLSAAKKSSGTATGGGTGGGAGAELPGGAPTGSLIYDKSKYGIKDDKGGCFVPIVTPDGTLQPFYVAVCPPKNANEIKVVGTGGVLYDVKENEQGNLVVIQTGGAELPVDEFYGINIVLSQAEYDALYMLTNGRISDTENSGLGYPTMLGGVPNPVFAGFTPNAPFETMRVNTIFFAGTNTNENQQLVLSFLKGLDVPSKYDYSNKVSFFSGGLAGIDFAPMLKSLWAEANKLGLLIPEYWSVKKGYLYQYLNTPLPNSRAIVYPIKYQKL